MAIQVAELKARLTADTGQFQASMAAAGKSSSKAETSVGGLGKSIVKTTAAFAGVASVAVGVKYAAKTLMDFESAMSGVQAATKANARDMGIMRKAAIELGAKTGMGATEAAKGLTELAKGGLTAKQSVNALKGTLALAAAGELAVADASVAVADALTLFNLRAGEASHVADAFAVAANTTTADVGDFTMAIKQAGGAARIAGLGFDDTVVALTALAKAGIKNSDAGTSLKAMLTQIGKPTKESAAAMKQLGLSFFDAKGEFKKLPALASNMRQAFGKLTKEQFLSKTVTIGGTDALRSLYAIYKAGPAGIRAFQKALQEEGKAAEVAAAKQNNLRGALARVKAQFDALLLTKGGGSLGPLQKGLDAISKSLENFRKNRGTEGQFAELAAGFVKAADKAGFLKMALSPLSGALNVVKGAIGGVSRLVHGDVIGSFKSFASMLKGMADPFAPLIRGAKAAYNALRNTGFGRAIGAALAPIVGAIKAITGPAVSAAKSLWNSINGIFSKTIGIKINSQISGSALANVKAGGKKGKKSTRGVRASLAFPEEGLLSSLEASRSSLQGSYDSADQRNRLSSLKGKVKSLAGKKGKGDELQTAKRDLASLQKEIARTKALGKIDLSITGAQNAVKLKEALQSIHSQLKGKMSDAVAKFREQWDSIQGAAFDAATETLIANTATAKELAKLRGENEAEDIAAEKARIDAAYKTASAEGDAAGMAAAEVERLRFERNQRIAQLERDHAAEVTQIEKDRAAERKRIEDEAAAAFEANLKAQLDAEYNSLAARTQNYAQFAEDVAGILGPLGFLFDGSADLEAALSAPTGSGSSGGKKKKKKAKKKAMGGLTSGRTWVGEHGPELVDLPQGTRVHTEGASWRMFNGAGGSSSGSVFAPTFNISSLDPAGAATAVKRALDEYERRNGPTYARA